MSPIHWVCKSWEKKANPCGCLGFKKKKKKKKRFGLLVRAFALDNENRKMAQFYILKP